MEAGGRGRKGDSVRRMQAEAICFDFKFIFARVLIPKTIVIIKADEAINHGQVVEVMDLLRQILGLKLAIAVKQKNVSPDVN